MEVMGRGLPLTIYTDAEAAQSSFSTDRLQRVSRVQTDLTAGIAGAGVHP
jgi:hypothetical protein